MEIVLFDDICMHDIWLLNLHAKLYFSLVFVLLMPDGLTQIDRTSQLFLDDFLV